MKVITEIIDMTELLFNNKPINASLVVTPINTNDTSPWEKISNLGGSRSGKLNYNFNKGPQMLFPSTLSKFKQQEMFSTLSKF